MNFLKKSALLLVLGLIMLSSAMVYARITHTLLVIDMQNSADLPAKFRSSADNISNSSNINTLGLDQLHVVGSHQFSKNSFVTALSRIPSKSVVVVDLRRESHGMLNDDAVSWYGPQDAANLNKTIPQIIASEQRLLNRLSKSSYRWVYDIVTKTDDGYVDQVTRNLTQVQGVQSEQQFVEQNHVGYQRFYVEDFHAPSDAEVNRFVNFAKSLPADTWLYFHCRGGEGRTTTFMTMMDMMKNAKQVSYDDIMARQLALGGSDLRDLPDNGSFKYPFAVERLSFLRQFYDYAKSNNDNFATSYSAWKKN